MTRNYKKGDTVLVTYKRPNHAHVMQSVGVVFEVSDAEIILAHNFTGLIPLDMTKIYLNKILESKEIMPIEIDSLSDLGKWG